MEEASNWTVYAIIIVVVILVVGIIVYKFYPETFSDIEKVADDVFKFGEEKKNEEIAQQVIGAVISSIVDCLEKSNQNCGCTLDMAQLKKLPDGYQVVIQNWLDKTDAEEEKFVLVTPAKLGDPLANSARVNEIEVSFAVPATATENGKNIAGIACHKISPVKISTQAINGKEKQVTGKEYENLILEKSGDSIIIKKGKYGPYKFYDDAVVQQIYRKGDNVCFITNAVEDRGNAANTLQANLEEISSRTDAFFIYKMSAAEFTSTPSEPTMILGTAGREATPEEALETTGSERTRWGGENERMSEIANGLLSIKNCEGAAGVDYPLIWPVSAEYITGLEDCGTMESNDATLQAFGVQREEGFERWIVIKTDEDSSVRVPVGHGLITDYCDSDCGEKGKSVTIYEYNPSTKRVTGRVIKISGMKTLDSKYKVKAEEIRTDGLFTGGLIVEGGETLGASLSEVILKEGIHQSISGSEDIIYRDFYPDVREWSERSREYAATIINRLLCIMPDLPDEYYIGGCKRALRQEQCIGITGRGSIYEIADKISNMEAGAQNTILNFNVNSVKYEKLIIVSHNDNDRQRGVSCPAGRECALPNFCPEGETCLCFKKAGTGNYCVKLQAHGFKPEFADGSVSSGGTDYKKVFYQRIGNTLGICETFPCIK